MPLWKIGSGDTANMQIIDRVLDTGAPVLLSTGMNITIATTNMTHATAIEMVTSTQPFTLSDGTTATGAAIDAMASSGAIGTVIDNIDKALDNINDTRATYGATQSRFDAIITNLQTGVENQSAARSRIMDADFAAETANMSRAQVLQQAGTAMVAQANQLPQQVLKLLQ